MLILVLARIGLAFLAPFVLLSYNCFFGLKEISPQTKIAERDLSEREKGQARAITDLYIAVGGASVHSSDIIYIRSIERAMELNETPKWKQKENANIQANLLWKAFRLLTSVRVCVRSIGLL